MQDFVEPYRGLAEDVGMLPGFPGIISLGFAGDESPVDGGDARLFGDGQGSVERAAGGAGHVFGAEDRTMESSQPDDFSFERLRPTVVVKGDDVGLAQLNSF